MMNHCISWLKRKAAIFRFNAAILAFFLHEFVASEVEDASDDVIAHVPKIIPGTLKDIVAPCHRIVRRIFAYITGLFWITFMFIMAIYGAFTRPFQKFYAYSLGLFHETVRSFQFYVASVRAKFLEYLLDFFSTNCLLDLIASERTKVRLSVFDAGTKAEVALTDLAKSFTLAEQNSGSNILHVFVLCRRLLKLLSICLKVTCEKILLEAWTKAQIYAENVYIYA